MSNVTRIATISLVIIFVAAVVWFCGTLIVLFIGGLSDANPQVTATVLGGIFTALVGLSAALYTQNQIKKRENDEAHRGKKVEIYSEFLHLVRRLMSGSNENIPVEPLAEDEMIVFMLKFKTEIILWSSPSVLNAFREFEILSASNPGFDKLFPAIDRFYREMRKDIGLSNWGLPENALVKMYLKDPTELDRALGNAL